MPVELDNPVRLCGVIVIEPAAKRSADPFRHSRLSPRIDATGVIASFRRLFGTRRFVAA
jgi:hypothetical protein